jgi:cobalamin-dependent methionine synthase I
VLAGLQDKYRTHALFQLFDANSQGDDIVLAHRNIPLLRQQHPGSECLCLADFVRPKSSGVVDRIGVFATSVDMGLETDFAHDAYQKMMVQLLADRLAEATAERMHEEVRKKYWGYAPNEQLTMQELHIEKFQGIRPAVGYPSLPDTSLNFVIDELIGLRQVGIRLTESGAMKPHASVSGLMLAHPQARYFAIGKIGNDQLEDYAHRRGLPVEVVRKFLSANL